ncbi:MAG: translational GTPase TypA [Clostridia bacterium]|nr:translational GTPase TypA [Clostridia bacterium]
MLVKREDIRNIAIIAHVDHGKTTLVDEMLKQSGLFRENQQLQDRMMDSGDIERERGITILSKNTSIRYKDTKINVVDTPGHADFGGEVERVLKMTSGVVLLVDSFEGPMPQTRFVLSKALELGLKVIVVINKMDRPDARPDGVADEVFDLFIELGADDSQLDCPFIYASGRSGTASLDPNDLGTDMVPLFDAILKYVPAPECEENEPVQMLVSTIDYNEYVGRIGIGKIERGTLKAGDMVSLCTYGTEGARSNVRITSLSVFEGLKRVNVESAKAGEIVAVSGVTEINIGDTLCKPDCIEPLPFVKITEPTVSMTFSVNDSPFAGKEGKYLTSRHIRARLYREIETDVSLRVEDTDSADSFKVSGRGELHLSILIENMRRQGYELQVSKPEVLYKTIDGKRCEPMERVIIDVPDQYSGTVIQHMGTNHGEMVNMLSLSDTMRRMEFIVPARGLFGYRSSFLTDTHGEGVMNSVFEGYAPYKGEMPGRKNGSLIAFETGESITYGLFNAQERGTLFIGAGEQVYSGMIVGESSRPEDIEVNVCKRKNMTNSRSAGSDDALHLIPPKRMSLEQALEYLGEDELAEITPNNIRIRKKILDPTLRYRAAKINSRQN